MKAHFYDPVDPRARAGSDAPGRRSAGWLDLHFRNANPSATADADVGLALAGRPLRKPASARAWCPRSWRSSSAGVSGPASAELARRAARDALGRRCDRQLRNRPRHESDRQRVGRFRAQSGKRAGTRGDCPQSRAGLGPASDQITLTASPPRARFESSENAELSCLGCSGVARPRPARGCRSSG